MRELFVFCNPRETYRMMNEREAARTYTKMAIEDYDSLISFDKSYVPFLATPDKIDCAGEKENKTLFLTLFAQQQINRIGNMTRMFTSSSYLFNPEFLNTEGLLLPDLDVVQISGEKYAGRAARLIANFYRGYGWSTCILEGAIRKRLVTLNNSRSLGNVRIADYVDLVRLAHEHVGYDLERLCFKNES